MFQDLLDLVGKLREVGPRVSGAHNCHVPTPFGEDVYATSRSGDKMQGGILLYVVVHKGSTILLLLSSKDQTLLVKGGTFLVRDLGLDIVNSVQAYDSQCISLSLWFTMDACSIVGYAP